METLKQQALTLARSYAGDVVAIRRHLHRHPELSCEEHETAAFICRKLEESGIEFRSGIAGTGVVALVGGRDPGSRCIALRADMDALPIHETNPVEYRSEADGKMHACGHDVHMACLLGAARILQEMRNSFTGTVKLIFQPSEETYPGGAIGMIGEGVLEDPAPQFVVAQHVINTLPAGTVGLKPGPYMASTDEFYITVKGRGGHAATPSQVVDPILVASHIIIALQQIVSRNADPIMPTVVSVGKISGQGRTNIIPDTVQMEGTIRTYSETWRAEVHRKITAIAEGIAASMGATSEVRIAHGYPYLFNDPALAGKIRSIAAEYIGGENVKELEQRMTAEDFAYFAQRVPSCMYRLGIANEAKGIVSNLHSATFDVDESSLETGMGLMAYVAIKLLSD